MRRFYKDNVYNVYKPVKPCLFRMTRFYKVYKAFNPIAETFIKNQNLVNLVFLKTL